MDENKGLSPYHASPFDAIRQIDESGKEFWSARNLQPLLGYEQWRRFEETIERAMIACQNTGYKVSEHFADAGKTSAMPNGGVKSKADYNMTRFACYLTAMNGDPRKPEIAAAQTYFAIKTREAETARPLPATTETIHLETIVASLLEEVAQLRALIKPKARPLSLTKESARNRVFRCHQKLETDTQKPVTARDISRYCTKIPVALIRRYLEEFAEELVLQPVKTSHTTKYCSIKQNTSERM